jgi:hypothetical protein
VPEHPPDDGGLEEGCRSRHETRDQQELAGENWISPRCQCEPVEIAVHDLGVWGPLAHDFVESEVSPGRDLPGHILDAVRFGEELRAFSGPRARLSVTGVAPTSIRTVADRTIRFVLTGAAGGCYTAALRPGDAPGRPDATIVADAIDVCRVAARRLPPDQLEVVIDGDRQLADLVLAGLDAFARD